MRIKETGSELFTKIESRKRFVLTTILLGTIAVLLSTVPVSAGTVYFSVNSLSHNTTLDGTLFGVDISSPEFGKVEFKFFNNQLTESYIYQIYWDDNASVLDFSSPSLADGFSTDFKGPGSLPGGNTYGPGFSEDFAVGAVKTDTMKKKDNAIGPGETAIFVFDLSGIATAGDVESALLDGSLLVGIHVQDIYYHTADGGLEGSDSFLSFPEPTTLILLLSSMGVLAGAARFRKKT